MNSPLQSNMILVGDDDADDRLLVRDAMEEIQPNISLRFACDGIELMDYLQHRAPFSEASKHPTPSLILLDLNMPRKNGREALREIRSDPELSSIPVVIWTTSCAVEDINRSYLDGAARFVTKPNSFGQIRSILQEIVSEYMAADEGT